MKTKLFFLFILISFLTITAQETKKEEIPDSKTFTKVEKEPGVIQQVKPIYPEEALKKGLTGRVVVRTLVDKDGNAKKVEIVKSSNKIFDQPAIDASMKTKYTPAIQGGKPIMCWVNMPYMFNRSAENKGDGNETTKPATPQSKKKSK